MIKFVNPQVNEAVKKYISTMIYNETQINIAKDKISENLNFTNKIDLCLDIECGTENPNGKKQSFDILTDKDLIYASSYSDTQIYVDTLNAIRSISQSDELQYLTDSEISQIMSIAGRIALIKARTINR